MERQPRTKCSYDVVVLIVMSEQGSLLKVSNNLGLRFGFIQIITYCIIIVLSIQFQDRPLSQQLVRSKLMLLRAYRNYFSIINKIRRREKMKMPPMERVKTKPHQIGDFVGTATFEERKLDLTPFHQYLLETKSMQRPYTGNLWGEISAGFYHCAVCDTRLFTFDQKFNNESGYACFYDCVEKRVNILDEKTSFEMVNIFSDPFLEQQLKKHKRCQCAQCKSHLGAVMFDGPFPTFLRFSVNSHSLVFKQLPDFPDPNIAKKERIKKYKESKIRYLK